MREDMYIVIVERPHRGEPADQISTLKVKAQAAALGKGECAMLICAAGDIHGAMDRLYHDVFAFEPHSALASTTCCTSAISVSGGSEPDRQATRRHDGVGDFPAWLRESRGTPRPTLSSR